MHLRVKVMSSVLDHLPDARQHPSGYVQQDKQAYWKKLRMSYELIFSEK